MQQVLSGNEAIARGAWEAGVKVAAAYPGTPSTEILENWPSTTTSTASGPPNEKVAMEVAIGAARRAARALAAMKHVGLNVAADPLFTSSYIGVRGGLVVVSADDPACTAPRTSRTTATTPSSPGSRCSSPPTAAKRKDFMVLGLRAVRAVRHPGAAPHHHPHLALQEPGRAGRARRSRAGASKLERDIHTSTS